MPVIEPMNTNGVIHFSGDYFSWFIFNKRYVFI